MPTLPTSESPVRNPGQTGQPAGNHNLGAVEKRAPGGEGSFRVLPEPWVPPSGGARAAKELHDTSKPRAPPSLNPIGAGSEKSRPRGRPRLDTPVRPSQPRPLAVLLQLPPDARVTSREASLLIHTSVEQLNNWRLSRQGPPHEGKKHFVRYRRGALDGWMAEQARL